MSYSQYGLTAVDAEGANHDKGIVAAPDAYYQIDGFKHGQEDDLDKDKGAAFSSSLAADAAEAGFNPSNFNTAGDVENALNAIGGSGSKDAPDMKGFHEPSDDLEMSKELSDAKERAQNWTKSKGMSGQVYGDGSRANPGEVDYDDIQAYRPTKKSVK